MTISMYGMTVPFFTRMLTNLLAIMDKADANAAERNFDTGVLVTSRLAPDMLPFRSQIQIATDHAKGCVSRLAGQPVPSWPDDETTFDELRARLNKTLDLLATVKPADLDGSDTRPVTLKLRSGDVTLSGEDYIVQRALPNFFFHVTTAYAILRHNGVPVGKSDFLG